jgi:formylglycine-generating enzyme required for sulfatase activity
MALAPAGTFTMGSPADEPWRAPDETQHEVTLTRSFYISTHEVTQSEWEAVMGWNDPMFPGPNLPVEGVNWYDAVAYCNLRSTQEGLTAPYTMTDVVYIYHHIAYATVAWNQAADGYRLPTEAEWEYACRATSTSAFCNGGITDGYCSPLDPNLDQVGWYCGNSWQMTHDVGGKAANAWGLQDMHGNVWELCWDWMGDYPAGPVTDPTGPEPSSGRVLRGGCYWYEALHCRSASRGSRGPGTDTYNIGFRVCRTAP